MPNALAALYSYGDGLKRKMNRLISDPAGTIDLGARRFNEDQNALQNLFANAFPMGGDKTVLNSPQQVAKFQGEATDKALETYGGLMGATVWHGSPHKFSKFDSGKIGTGEGAQAYGHGLYLADAPDVARTYSADRAYVGAYMAGKPLPINYNDPAFIAQKTMDELGDAVKAKAHLEMVQRTAGKYQPPETKVAVQGAIDMISSGKVGTKGSLYKVDLPDEHIAKMLDWDKPLSQQAPMTQQRIYDSMLDAGFDKAITNHILNNKTGRELMNELGGRLAVRNPSPMSGSAQASEFVKKAGIPGIRYLDEGSRAAGTGTSNYVVFPGNENLLQILERNGQAIK
jgi:hypothetical protein